ncbi:MAG: 1-acyl-sn-glycerol-3-phosphate acyltransferase [Ruminiclostridium sp.]|nr:1-acyl-sn-glycerol-3-phosphate acyltransferase [Ruminiclostridium sp.]
MTKYEFMYSASKIVFNVASFLKPKRVYGVENVPEGPAVICANHAHFSDPFYIIHAIPRRHKIWVMSKDEVRHWPVVGPLLAWSEFIIFVKRGKADIGAVKSALKALKGGEKLLIFPEGTRHDEIGEGKTGAAMMAIRSNVPILPVHISSQRKFFRPIEIRFGQPYMPFTEDRKANAEDYQVATDALMEKIKVLGQEEKA